MFIDAHVNITHDGQWYHTTHCASLDRLLNEMNETQIDKCVLISMPNATSNEYINSLVEKYPEKFKGFGHLDFSQNIEQQLNTIASSKLSGILHKGNNWAGLRIWLFCYFST